VTIVNHEEVKNRLLANPKIREAYENPPLSLATAREVVRRRKELGMTQGQLADAMGTSQAQVWRIESGHFNPTAKTLMRLEHALDMSFGARFRDLPRASQASPREQLEEWRKAGILAMSDDDFEQALELEETDPGHLGKLVRIIENIELEGNGIQVTVRLESADREGDRGSGTDAPRLALSATI
jgi:transcriptional regulator with XRE-family HTH domain